MDNVLRLPFSTPPNTLVISARKYTFMDYVKVGLLLQITDGNRYGIYITFIIPILNIRTRILVLYLQFVKQYKKIYGYTV